MMARIKIFLLEKRRLIVMTILSAYLIALTVKTAHLYYTEVWTNAEPPGQSLDVDGVK